MGGKKKLIKVFRSFSMENRLLFAPVGRLKGVLFKKLSSVPGRRWSSFIWFSICLYAKRNKTENWEGGRSHVTQKQDERAIITKKFLHVQGINIFPCDYFCLEFEGQKAYLISYYSELFIIISISKNIKSINYWRFLLACLSLVVSCASSDWHS